MDKISRRIEQIRGYALKNADITDEDLLTHVADLALNGENEATKVNASKLIMQARGLAQPKERRSNDVVPLTEIKNFLTMVVTGDKAEEILKQALPDQAMEAEIIEAEAVEVSPEQSEKPQKSEENHD